MDDDAAEADYSEREYLARFCVACGDSPCTWDGKPDGFHTDEKEQDHEVPRNVR